MIYFHTEKVIQINFIKVAVCTRGILIMRTIGSRNNVVDSCDS